MDQPVEPHAIAEPPQFLAGEQAVERHSEELKKELSLPNLVFTQVLSIVGLSWIGTAARLGGAHLAFWMAAIALFYIPSAAIVIHLNNEMPLEGGLYQWAKLRFNEMTGFLVAWNLWIYAIVFVSEMGLLVTNNLSYAMGPSGAWLANSKPAIAAASVIVTAFLVVIARLGLGIGKWIHGLAGFSILFLFAAMAFFAIPHWFHGTVAHPPLALAVPAFTLLNLNILGKMGFGAMGGFDSVAIFAGECRGDNAATIRRSVWIATPLIAGAFILGTACVLVFTRPADIDLISPITQVLNRGISSIGLTGSATSLVGALIVATLIGQAVLSFNWSARLPLVAGYRIAFCLPMVYSPAIRKPQNARRRHRAHRRDHRDGWVADKSGRRQSGGLSDSAKRQRHRLRIGLPGNVRHPAARAGRKALPATARGRRLGFRHDSAERRSFRVSHHRRPKPLRLRREDRRGRARPESRRSPVLLESEQHP